MEGQKAAARQARLMDKLDVLCAGFKGRSSAEAGASALECLRAGAWMGCAADSCAQSILEGPDALGWLGWLGELKELRGAGGDFMLLGKPYMELSLRLARGAAKKLPDARSGLLFYRRLIAQDPECNQVLGAEGLFALAARFPGEAEKCADAAYELAPAPIAFRPVNTVAFAQGARVAKTWFMAFAKNAGEDKASSLLRALCARGMGKQSPLAREDDQWSHGDMADDEFLLAVEGLLAGGAKPNLPDSLGQTALRHLNRHCDFRAPKALASACAMFFAHGAQPEDLFERLSPVQAARKELKGLVEAQAEKISLDRAASGSGGQACKRKL